jgi:uncharacterized protein with ParB-like and HNH nuclease domain
MEENFVLEIARRINEPGQQRIDKLFGLIKEANRLQKELAKVLLEISSIKEEWYNGFNEEENKK